MQLEILLATKSGKKPEIRRFFEKLTKSTRYDLPFLSLRITMFSTLLRSMV